MTEDLCAAAMRDIAIEASIQASANVFNLIKEAALAGRFYVDCQLSDLQVELLQKKGYRVEPGLRYPIYYIRW